LAVFGFSFVSISALAEGNRIRTALLAAVSHDLRSPLAAIKAAISSLRNTDITWSDSDEAELLATVEESADRLDGLVGNLLDMSRLQTGAINPLLTEVDLSSAVGWALGPIPGSDEVQLAPTLICRPRTRIPGCWTG
jgi:two-component system sensor histidine kinase KdpD